MAGHSKWSEIKRRKGLTETRDRARRASRRMIANGERPVFRPKVEPDGDILFHSYPGTRYRHLGTPSNRRGGRGA